jgi:hypothetical protein
MDDINYSLLITTSGLINGLLCVVTLSLSKGWAWAIGVKRLRQAQPDKLFIYETNFNQLINHRIVTTEASFSMVH